MMVLASDGKIIQSIEGADMPAESITQALKKVLIKN